jgi:hypothetical protein
VGAKLRSGVTLDLGHELATVSATSYAIQIALRRRGRLLGLCRCDGTPACLA